MTTNQPENICTSTTVQIAALEAARVAWDLVMSNESSHAVVLDAAELADARGAAEAAILAARYPKNSQIQNHTAFIVATWDCHGARLAAPEAVALPRDASLAAIVTIRTPYALDGRTLIPVLSDIRSDLEQLVEEQELHLSTGDVIYIIERQER